MQFSYLEINIILHDLFLICVSIFSLSSKISVMPPRKIEARNALANCFVELVFPRKEILPHSAANSPKVHLMTR